MLVGERKFIVDAPRQRIWDLLLRATMRLMPFERCNIRSQAEFTALLRMKVGPIKLPMQVEIKIVDIVPPDSLNTRLNAKSMGGIVWIIQKATFKLSSIDEGRTEVDAKAFIEGMSPIIKLFFLPMVKGFVNDSYKLLEERLKQWA